MRTKINASTLTRWAAIPLRAIVGYGFIAHGYAKVANGPAHFIGILHNIGVPAPGFMGWTTILVEIAGGLAVLVGAFVPLVSAPMTMILLVAALTRIFRTASVRSSFKRSRRPAPNSVRPATRPTSYTLHV